jgi:serine/threonine protein kinase
MHAKPSFVRLEQTLIKPYQKAELTFDVIEEIGQDGQNSRTYVSHDHQLNAKIVTKQIAKKKLNSPLEFFAESQGLYASSHPNVVQIHYACFDDESIYLAMPYYSAGSVKQLMSNRSLTVREIITLGAQMLAGLHNIHSKNLVHFDIKPDNILLSPQGEALISDFGQAKQMNYSGVAAQDRHYGKMIPPEALVTTQFDLTFDIYQIGLTLYRMCNGNNSFNEQFAIYGPANNFDKAKFNIDLRNGRFPDRTKFLPHIPSTLRNVIKRCLEVDKSARFQSAIAVANALAGIDGKCLDWQYLAQPEKDTWQKNENGTHYELTRDTDGSTSCYKTLDGGVRRRVVDACKLKVTDMELRKLFTNY